MRSMPSDCRDSCQFFPISEHIEEPRIVQHIRSAAFAVTGSARPWPFRPMGPPAGNRRSATRRAAPTPRPASTTTDSRPFASYVCRMLRRRCFFTC
jgi:hypothetical protein